MKLHNQLFFIYGLNNPKQNEMLVTKLTIIYLLLVYIPWH